VSGLQQATSQAVETLEQNLTCGIPASEIAAAKAILDQAFRGLEVIDLAERIERAQNGSAEWRPPSSRV
jgi:hypothetical protein